MKNRALIAAASFGLCVGLWAADAPKPVWSENFDALPGGAMITKANTALTLVRRSSQTDFAGKVVSRSPSSFTQGSLLIESSGYGSMPNLVGVGVNGLPSSPIYTLVMEIGSMEWKRNTCLFVLLGASQEGSEIYQRDGRISVAGFTPQQMAAASLVAVRLGAGGENARLESLQQQGGEVAFQSVARPSVVIGNGEARELRLIANGTDSEIDVGSTKLPARHCFIYLDGRLVARVPTSGARSANAFRLYAQGFSPTHQQLTVEVDSMALYAAAVAPAQ